VKLLIVSHTAHYLVDGEPRGWGPTVREIDRLARLFDEVVHLAPLHGGAAPASALPYESGNIRHVPVRPAGGTSTRAKLGVLRAWVRDVRVMRREMRRCDIVHVRCPSNLGLLAILMLAVSRNPKRRWIKYAGNWKPTGPEGLSYRLQRWLLRRGVAGAVVTVNGHWPDQRAHVRSFLNPCLTGEELREGAAIGSAKSLSSPLRLLFVGRLEEAKGCGRTLEITEGLIQRGIDARLDLVGDGPDRAALASRIEARGLWGGVRLLGSLPRGALNDCYSAAHVLLLPSSSSEGWPKVLSEGMAYGVVPVASTVSSIPEYLELFGVGRALDAHDCRQYVETIAGYVRDPERWKEESRRAMDAAAKFSYENYLVAVREVLQMGLA
jgi:glycosyltransferase involved in cell wall biosynthesis